MRFSRLALERYGRFEGCELDFRRGSPDLHVIYGANEAGKTTSLAAVSDLLFGFQTRSPYNFMFDYALLRIGAVLEDGENTIACRRKKAISGSLLDAGDSPIDDVALLAMLKGQTRDTFGLSFSLDQRALRAGGQAMVEARNDLGRTLFAAGSGLTGIADELARLEAEADAIWAPTTAMRRSFTQAHRQLADATKTVRDESLKPKSWSDARSLMLQAEAALDAVQTERDLVLAELASAQRTRRLLPMVRLHEEQTRGLLEHALHTDLGKQAEDEAERIIREAEEALRLKAIAEQLRDEAKGKRDEIAGDPVVLARADEIDRLVENGGAVAKAALDLVRREDELATASALTARLRAEAGPNADAKSTRASFARLRDLARADGELAAAIGQLDQSRADVEDRLNRAKASLAAVPAPTVTATLVDAVDAARALGSDADDRCVEASRQVDAASAALADMIARLAPWAGAISDLLKLPLVGDDEIDTARDRLSELAAEARREDETARAASEQSAGVILEIGQLATGAVVSGEDIATARQSRHDRWQPIRDHVLTGMPLTSPEDTVASYESMVALVDDKMTLRFSSAEASSRLSMLESSKAAHELAHAQAAVRRDNAIGRRNKVAEAWASRLAADGLPELEPDRCRTWQVARDAAQELYRAREDMIAKRDDLVSRRDARRSALSDALQTQDIAGPLAPVLAAAERVRAEFESSIRQRTLASGQQEQAENEAGIIQRRHQRLTEEAAANVASWQTTVTEAGLRLEIHVSKSTLDLLDELRDATVSEAEQSRRVAAIRLDASDHAERVNSLADDCLVPAGDAAARLARLRDRLSGARAAAALIGSLVIDIRRREEQVEEEAAKLRVLDGSLAGFLQRTASSDRAGLSEAIERSRVKRRKAEELANTEHRIVAEGDGFTLGELMQQLSGDGPGDTGVAVSALESRLMILNAEVASAATAHGDARSSFTALDTGETAAMDAASDAEQARAELEVLSDRYILKRSQALTLKWAIEKYRQRHQDPLLLRAGELFTTLTAGSFVGLRVDADGPSPRLLGLRDDGRTLLDVGAMSEGTTDQLFLALRLAALEQSVRVGIELPFLADDLFVNFDDERAEAGFKVLAEVAKSTQILFFTHHPHLVGIAKSIVGADLHSECSLV